MSSLFRHRSRTPSGSAPKIAQSASQTSGVSAAASNAEAPPSTTAPSQRPKLDFSAIASLFIRLRRHQSRASLASQARKEAESSQASAPAGKEPTPPRDTVPHATFSGPHPMDDSGRLILTPPVSPNRSRVRRLTGELVRSPYARRRTTSGATKPKAHHLVSTSGGTPITQSSVRDSILMEAHRSPVTYTDVFEVVGGVSTPTLLRATKRAILEAIEAMGLGNSVAEEQWECTICGPKKQNCYKVQINYSAVAVTCTRPDGFRPVALDKAKTIEGLMTITKRNDL